MKTFEEAKAEVSGEYQEMISKKLENDYLTRDKIAQPWGIWHTGPINKTTSGPFAGQTANNQGAPNYEPPPPGDDTDPNWHTIKWDSTATGGGNNQVYQPNRLVITHYPALVDDLVALVASFDVPERVVLIEARILETTRDDQSRLGLLWPTSVGVSLTDAPKAVTSTHEDPTTSEQRNALFKDLKAGDWQWGTLSVAQLQTVLDLLEQDGHTKLISDPRITTVGKSSLFNMLLNEERAIVTPLPGTTLDCIEEMLVIKGIPLKLADTAGLRDAADIIEEEGVRITNQKLDRADLTVLVIAGSIGLDKCDEELLNRLRGTKTIVVCNKTDLPAKVSPDMLKRHFPERQIVATSALHRTGIEELKDAITSALLSNGTCLTSPTVITTVRHASALEKTLESLEHAKQGLHNHIPPEFIAADLQFAVHHLGQITGSSSSEEVLDQIFSRFCIGK